MKQTANYQLNQWDAGDRILRTEFNADNEKIDAAIKTVDTRLTTEAAALRAEQSASAAALWAAMPYVKLADVTTATAAQQINVNLQGLNLLQYRRIEVDVLCPAKAKTLLLRVNNISWYAPGSSTSSVAFLGRLLTGSAGYPTGFFRFNPPFRNTHIACYYESIAPMAMDSGVNQTTTLMWESLEALNFYLADGTELPVGSKFRVYGVRV